MPGFENLLMFKYNVSLENEVVISLNISEKLLSILVNTKKLLLMS